MRTTTKQFCNHHTSTYKRNSIQLALKKVNFKFHRTNSSLALLEDPNASEQIILSTDYSSEDKRKHIPLLMASHTPNVQNEGELRCMEQQTEQSIRLTEGAPAQNSPPVALPGRPPSILGSVCALLLAKQASPPKDIVSSGSSMCRICFGGASGARLVRPCGCRGTVAAVHRACLERWLLAAATSYCELCRHHYVVTRRHKWTLWRSVWEWCVCGGGCALAADAARGALLGVASVLGTARALHAADALLHAAAAKGGVAALAANVVSSVLIGIIGALNGLLTTWILLKVQEHQASWRTWRDSTVLVRVALDEPTPASTPSNASFTTVESTPADHNIERATDYTDPIIDPTPLDLPDTDN